MLRMISSASGLTVAQSLGDVKEWDTYFAPDDDIHGVLIAELQRATDSKLWPACPQVASSQFGFTDQDVADLFAKLAANGESRYLFDRSQEGGHAENPIVKQFVTEVANDQWAIGTSPVAHQILHTKAVAILYPDGSGWTFTGSYNLSHSAGEQFNIVDVTVSRSRAELFVKMINKMFDYVKTHEHYQP